MGAGARRGKRMGGGALTIPASACAGQHLGGPLVEALALCLGGRGGPGMDLGRDPEEDLPGIRLLGAAASRGAIGQVVITAA